MKEVRIREDENMLIKPSVPGFTPERVKEFKAKLEAALTLEGFNFDLPIQERFDSTTREWVLFQ